MILASTALFCCAHCTTTPRRPLSTGPVARSTLTQPPAAARHLEAGIRQAPLPLVAQGTALAERGALMISTSHGHRLLRWSEDSVYLHEGHQGALLERHTFGYEILNAALAPDLQQLCVLAAQPDPQRRLARLLAYRLEGGQPHLLWKQSGLPLGLQGGVLATRGYCAALLPSATAAMPRPVFYRAFDWEGGKRLWDSAPMVWQHRQLRAVQEAPRTGQLLALLSNRGAISATSTLVAELIAEDHAVPLFTLTVDCARFEGGHLLLSGGGLAPPHLRWLRAKSAYPVTLDRVRCAPSEPKALLDAPAAGRVLRSVGEPARLVLFTRGGAPVRTLARASLAGLAPGADDHHLRAGQLLLASAAGIYQIDLARHRARRLGPLPEGQLHAPPFWRGGAEIGSRARQGKNGRVQPLTLRKGVWVGGESLPPGSLDRPRPDGLAFRLVPSKWPLQPRDARWFQHEGKWQLVAYEPLAGVFVLDAERKRLLRRCCRRGIGSGGIFGLALAPDRRRALVLFTGARPTLQLLKLPSLKPEGPPLVLAHRRNDYARTVWLDGERVAVLRDSRFVRERPTVAIYALAGGDRIASFRLEDRGPVFWSAERRQFYQLLEGDQGVRFFSEQGATQLTVGLVEGQPFFLYPDRRYRCVGAACAAVACRPVGRTPRPRGCPGATP